MRKFVGEIQVDDETVMKDIVNALETCPWSGREYEVDMIDRASDFDPCGKSPTHNRFKLMVFVKETV